MSIEGIPCENQRIKLLDLTIEESNITKKQQSDDMSYAKWAISGTISQTKIDYSTNTRTLVVCDDLCLTNFCGYYEIPVVHDQNFFVANFPLVYIE